jgi:hypothetical protein
LPLKAPGDSIVDLSGWNISEQTLHLSAGKATASPGSPAE